MAELDVVYDDDEPVEETAESVPEENTEESAPEEEGAPGDDKDEKTEKSEKGDTFTEEEQEKVDRVVNKRLARQYDQLQKARERAEAAEAQLAKVAPTQTRPVVPPLPDRFDDDFDKAMEARDSAIIAQAAFDSAERTRAELHQKARQEQEQAARAEAGKQVEDFVARGRKVGIKQEELMASIRTISSAQLNPEMVKDIVLDKHGPKVMRYLAQNLGEAETLRGMSPYKAGAYIENVIIPKATQKPVPSAPPPTGSLKGSGGETSGGPEGVIYE